MSIRTMLDKLKGKILFSTIWYCFVCFQLAYATGQTIMPGSTMPGITMPNTTMPDITMPGTNLPGITMPGLEPWQAPIIIPIVPGSPIFSPDDSLGIQGDGWRFPELNLDGDLKIIPQEQKYKRDGDAIDQEIMPIKHQLLRVNTVPKFFSIKPQTSIDRIKAVSLQEICSQIQYIFFGINETCVVAGFEAAGASENHYLRIIKSNERGLQYTIWIIGKTTSLTRSSRRPDSTFASLTVVASYAIDFNGIMQIFMNDTSASYYGGSNALNQLITNWRKVAIEYSDNEKGAVNEVLKRIGSVLRYIAEQGIRSK